MRDFLGLSRRLPLTLLTAWMQRPYLGQSHLTTVSTPQVMHVYVHGRLSADTAASLAEAAHASIANGLVMVVHLQAVRQMTAAGLGSLMDVRRQLLEAGLSMSLAGLNFKLRFLLYAWCAQPLFDEWQPATAHGRSLMPDAEMPARIDLAVEQDVLPAQTRFRG